MNLMIPLVQTDIPISMVSSPYFNANRPMYMNLGASGTYIATNIFKSISFFGRKSTEAGELATNDRVDCFRNEFVNLTDASKPNVRILRSKLDMAILMFFFPCSYATGLLKR